MILKTDWPGFLEELTQWPSGLPIYLARQGVVKTASSHDHERGLTIMCTCVHPLTEVSETLQAMGRSVKNGRWISGQDAQEIDQDFWIAGIAYRTEEDQPGLWMDAFPHPPTASEILTSLLDEFVSEGVVDDQDRDQFAKWGSPNIILLSPDEIQSFLDRHNSRKVEESTDAVEEVEP